MSQMITLTLLLINTLGLLSLATVSTVTALVSSAKASDSKTSSVDFLKHNPDIKIPNHIAIIMDGNGRWGTKKFTDYNNNHCDLQTSLIESSRTAKFLSKVLINSPVRCVRSFGHQYAGDRVEELIEHSARLGVKQLSLFAFAQDNWKRGEDEVRFLMSMFTKFLQWDELQKRLEEGNIKMRIIGELSVDSEYLFKKLEEHYSKTQSKSKDSNDYKTSNLDKTVTKHPLSLTELKQLHQDIKKAEEKSKNNTGMVLNILIDYSGSWEQGYAMREFAKEFAKQVVTNSDKNQNQKIQDLSSDLINVNNNIDKVSESENLDNQIDLQMYDFLNTDNNKLSKMIENYYVVNSKVDLLIRTGGEKRISDFLPTQTAYSEIVWVNEFFPDFKVENLNRCIEEFSGRQRRFGKTPEQVKKEEEGKGQVEKEEEGKEQVRKEEKDGEKKK